ncbi:MAG: Sir2 family NAD-dependent protein deacetylase, partial [Thermodesulfobacteriota bacterium]|nr:Sir2 family NAD-dependent protein deacetylase [Thermodesulfobacteriota bacterium]
EKYDPVEFAHIESFRAHPEKSWKMLMELIGPLNKAKPNPGHFSLAELEKMGILTTIITQNIDGLHQEAGNTDVIEFHGNNRYVVCLSCKKRYKFNDISVETLPPKCECSGILKPDAVFFGEPIPTYALNRAYEVSGNCKAMLVVGTSAVVYPAASMPEFAKTKGAIIIEVNPQETPLTHGIADCFVKGSAGEIMPLIIKEVKNLIN